MFRRILILAASTAVYVTSIGHARAAEFSWAASADAHMASYLRAVSQGVQ
jgi:hypothetical protein